MLCAAVVVVHLGRTEAQNGLSQPSEKAPNIDLALSASSDELVIGGKPITIRTELHNRGNNDFYVGRELVALLNTPAHIEILVRNTKGAAVLLDSGYIDYQGPNIEDWWIRIAPGHYYGFEFPVKTDVYKAISVPGAYQLQAKYVSRGGTVPRTLDQNLPPTLAWRGEIESNKISIRVLEPRKPQ
jgi:hypothetical protein